MTLIEILQNTGGFVCTASILIGLAVAALLWRFRKVEPKEGDDEG